MVEPNRILETIKPVKIDKTAAGGWLIDMGKNFTGWLELRLPANLAAGKNLKIEFADDPPAGNRYATFNQRDEYVDARGSRPDRCAPASTITPSVTPTSRGWTRRRPWRTSRAISSARLTRAPASSSLPTSC